MASNESDIPMTKPVADMTAEEIAAERASIARERAELDALSQDRSELVEIVQARSAMVNGNGEVTDADRLLAIRDQMIASEIISPDELIIPAPPSAADVPKLEPWAYDTKTLDDGHVLEYRKPDSSAMIAISMVGMDGFTATQQSELFNKFMGKHLSLSSLAYVLGRMADPDDDFGLSELITVLTAE